MAAIRRPITVASGPPAITAECLPAAMSAVLLLGAGIVAALLQLELLEFGSWLRLGVAQVIAVRVGDQDHVDRAEPRIGRAGHGVPGIVKDADTGRILEQDRPVLSTEFTGALSQRCDLDVRGIGEIARRHSPTSRETTFGATS